MYTIEITKRFEKDLKKYKKKHYDLSIVYDAVEHLQNDNRNILKTKYKDHQLKGEWDGFRELHLSNDWLLVYIVNNDKLILTLTRMGSHDDLGLS